MVGAKLQEQNEEIRGFRRERGRQGEQERFLPE